MYESIYLLQTRESIKNDEAVYKVGRTCQDELKRFNIYPRGSVLHLHVSCHNSLSVEKRVLEEFNKQFRNEPVYGKEYFHGNLLQMLSIVCREVGLSFNCADSSQDFCRSLLKVKNEADRAATLQEKRCQALEKENNRLLKRVTDLQSHINELIKDDDEDCGDEAEWSEEDTTIKENTNNVGCMPCTQPHIENKHKFQCDKCDRVLSSKRQLGYHQAKCTGLHPRQCPVCLKIFSTRQGKYEHIKNVKCSPPT